MLLGVYLVISLFFFVATFLEAFAKRDFVTVIFRHALLAGLIWPLFLIAALVTYAFRAARPAHA